MSVIRLNCSGIQPGRSEKGQQLAVPQPHVYFCNAAETDVPAMQPVLTLSAKRRPTAQHKAAPEGAAVDRVVTVYAR